MAYGPGVLCVVVFAQIARSTSPLMSPEGIPLSFLAWCSHPWPPERLVPELRRKFAGVWRFPHVKAVQLSSSSFRAVKLAHCASQNVLCSTPPIPFLSTPLSSASRSVFAGVPGPSCRVNQDLACQLPRITPTEHCEPNSSPPAPNLSPIGPRKGPSSCRRLSPCAGA